MKRITLSPELLSRLRELQEGAAICDADGQPVGFFSPTRVLYSETRECPLSPEEILRISAEGGGDHSMKSLRPWNRLHEIYGPVDTKSRMGVNKPLAGKSVSQFHYRGSTAH